MTREEQQKAIDVLKISAPVTAVTQEEFNDYIQTLNKIMNWIEQEPCADAISRQAAINVAVDAVDDWDGGCNKTREEYIRKALETIPPVTPQYTDAEIQKMQDLEFAEIQKAYEIGKAEGSSEWIPVSEIEDIKSEINELSELDHIEPTYEDCKRDVLEIINKHTSGAKMEVEE